MELKAVLMALRAMTRSDLEVCIRSDSRYTIDCCSRWLTGWKARGWRRKGGALKNVDLLQELDQELASHRVCFEWVKGHSGDPGNEDVDLLLNAAMDPLQDGRSPEHERRFEWALEQR